MGILSLASKHNKGPQKGLYFILEEFLARGEDMHSFEIRTEKAMATRYNTLAWKIPWAEEPGRLQSMGLGRVEHD